MADVIVANPCSGVIIGADYTDDERDLLIAVDSYKRQCHRPHPTWREVLAVIESLGWRRVAEPAELPRYRPRSRNDP